MPNTRTPLAPAAPVRVHGRHRTRVYAITVRSRDEDTGLVTLRGVGFRFVCSCGARGKRHGTFRAAAFEADWHREQ